MFNAFNDGQGCRLEVFGLCAFFAMAGCGAYAKLQGFAILPIMSFALALSTFTSELYQDANVVDKRYLFY